MSVSNHSSRTRLLLNNIEVGVAVSNKLKKLVAIITRFSTKLSYLLIVLRYPWVLQDMFQAYPVPPVFSQKSYTNKKILNLLSTRSFESSDTDSQF
jgi:hypothetical protein